MAMEQRTPPLESMPCGPHSRASSQEVSGLAHIGPMNNTNDSPPSPEYSGHSSAHAPYGKSLERSKIRTKEVPIDKAPAYDQSRIRWTPGMPAPYETPDSTPTMIDSIGSTAAQVPMSVPSPLTPPDSPPGRSVHAREYPAVRALPGTMSARRPERPSYIRHRSPEKTENEDKPGDIEDQSSTTFGARIRSTLRGLFRRSPSDDAEFEKIGERHWTDD